MTHGIICPGETVTWQGRHFGLLLKHTSRIIRYEPPFLFEDAMVKGMFKSFRHTHMFEEQGDSTVMREELQFAAPFGPLGWIAERVALRSHMSEFLRIRNRHIKQTAESNAWRRYLQSPPARNCVPDSNP